MMTQRAVLYARVSGDDRGKDGRNLKGQLAMCREYAQEHGYVVVEELAEDDRGASGASWDLPKLNRALEMARADDFEVLVVRELDRFARKLAKQLVVETEFQRAGTEVEYVLAEYDDSPEGQLQKHVRAVIAEFEREKIKERMVRGRYGKIKAGSVLVHGFKNAPYGYRLIELENGRRTFEIDEKEAEIVRMIFEWCVQGDGTRGPMGRTAIANELTRLGVPTRRGRRRWPLSTVRKILNRTAYYGKWRYGKDNADLEPLIVEVPAIVDRETWDLAQKQCKRNRDGAESRVKYPYLIRRFGVCGVCGLKMMGSAQPHKSGHTLYYRCAAHARPWDYSQPCSNNAYYRADQVDAATWDTITGWLLRPDALKQKLEDSQEKRAKENEPLRARLAVVDDLLNKNREQMERLLDLYLAGDFPKEVLTERKTRLHETIAALA
jgi:site-specific DNA recombinase